MSAAGALSCLDPYTAADAVVIYHQISLLQPFTPAVPNNTTNSKLGLQERRSLKL